MIRFVIARPVIARSNATGWLVEHPTNGAILAYCSTPHEAQHVAECLLDLAMQFAREHAEAKIARLQKP